MQMAAMGEAGPSDWEEELDRTGRVVFPLRNGRGWLMLAFAAAIGVQGYFGSAWDMLTEDGWFILGVIYWVVVTTVAGRSVWRLLTRQPVLTVDRTGLRFTGRKPGRLNWADVSSIGPVSGSIKGFQVLPILPKDIWAKTFDVNQQNVKDLPALAHWLTEVRAEVTPSKP